MASNQLILHLLILWQKDFAQAFPAFQFTQYSAYGQDEIAFNKKFKLTFGLRLDLPTYPDVSEVKTHPIVDSLTFAEGVKINTGNLPKSTPYVVATSWI